MKNKLLIIFALCLVSGCSTVKEWIPSFNDLNQSSAIVDVRFRVDRLDCAKPQLAQVIIIRDHLTWFELYSESAGWRHADVRRVIAPMQATVEDMYTRVQIKDGSKVYCELKKSIMQEQAAHAARVILGRF
jgi:hypothetical protein